MARKTLSIILAFVFVLSCMFTFSSCSSVKEFEEKESPVGGLVCISIQNDFIEGSVFDQYILYDPETFVMYSFIAASNGSVVTILYNADGTPKLYTPTKIEKGE